MYSFCIRLGKRFVGYGSVGVTAFLLDITLLTLLITLTSIPFTLALTLSFLTGATVNFLLQYNVVYAGTERAPIAGYVFFIALALTSLFLIAHGTWFVVQHLAIPFLAARVLVGVVSGCINFLLNTFFNFKMV